MPIFNYLAKNDVGDSVRGKVEAQTVNQAAKVLMARGLLVIHVGQVGEESFKGIEHLFNGIKHQDLVNFTRQLATMIDAGLPLATSLSILERQSTPQMTKLVTDILKEVESGLSFSQALAKSSKVFSRVYLQLVKAGETGGMLDNVLNRLADTLEREKEFQSKVKGAMIYPIIVLTAMAIVGVIMMIFVVPQLVEMYKDFGAELPISTKILIAVSAGFNKFWWMLLALIAGGVALFRAFAKTKMGRWRLDKLMMKMPVFGELRKKIILTEFARTLSLLLGAGVSLIGSLEIVGEAISSIIYREAIKEATKQVEKGAALSKAIEQHEDFPPILPQMMAVGEETGKLNEILLKLATYFQNESEQAVRNLTTAMEPLIMVVLGIGVGLMVVSIITPIYNLTAQF